VVTATTWGLFYDELRKWATQKTDRKEGDGLRASHDLALLFQAAFEIEREDIKVQNPFVEMRNLGTFGGWG
jgi:hypothetical protein